MAKLKNAEKFFIVSNASEAASSIVSSILTAFAGRSLDSLGENVKEYIRDKDKLAHKLKYAIFSEWTDAIEQVLYNDYKEMIPALKAGIGQGVGATHAGLYESLLGTNQLLQSYMGLRQAIGIDPYMNRYFNAAFQPNIPDAESLWLMYRRGKIDTTQYDNLILQDGWSWLWQDALEAEWSLQAPIDMLLEFTRRRFINEDKLKDLLKWHKLTDESIDNVAKLVVQYPEPYRIAEMHSKGLTTTEEYLGVSRIFGLEDKWALNWVEDQYKYPDFTTALALLRRNAIDESNFYYYMVRQQVKPEDAEAMLSLREVIPPISDLVRFAVREAYGDHDPEKQYAAMVSQANRMGLTNEAAEWYWYSHWDRIPITLMYANYHRGLWDKAKLERMLKIADVHPDDRADIINVAFAPPSIRELGYGWDVGIYTGADITKYRRFGGLSPEDAEKSSLAMVIYRTEAERSSVRTANMRLYALGKQSREEFEAAIRAITPQEAAVKLWMERGDLEYQIRLKPAIDTEGRIVSSSEALAAFKLKLRNEEWTRAQLKALDWTQDRIDVAIERAKLEIAEKEKEDEEVKYRKLTLAQLASMYKYNLITKEQMTTEIIIIGYSPDDAETLTNLLTRPEVKPTAVKNYTIPDAFRLYHYQLLDEDDIYQNYLDEGYDEDHAAMLTLMTRLNLDYPILRTLYEKGYINTEQLKAELIKMGMDEYDAILLIKRTQYELGVSRLAPERELTKAEILKGAKNNVITVSQASSLLQDMGYDSNEAMYLLAINKVVAAGDPEGYWEMRRVTENYKRAKGEKYIEIPDELIMLEGEIKKQKVKIEQLQTQKQSEELVAEAVLALNTLEVQYRAAIQAVQKLS